METPYHPPVKRSVEIAGHKTSISLEPLFWAMLKAAAAREGVPINALVARIDAERIAVPTPPGLAGAIRIWLVQRMSVAPAERPAAPEGRAGEGSACVSPTEHP